MKIGIITQPLESNYGGIIQNYALQQVLIKMGHSPITIDQPSHYPLSLFHYIIPDLREIAKNLVRIFLQKELHILPSRKVHIQEECGSKIKPFVDKNILHTHKLYRSKDLISICKSQNIEALLVGSDQVWRPKYNLKIENSFLEFALNLNLTKLSYGASFGTDKWEYSMLQTRKIKNLIKRFDAVSVRELSAVKLCKEHLGIVAEQVLDPTLLLGKNEYDKIAERDDSYIPVGDLFCYILDLSQEKLNIINKVSKEYNLNPYTVFGNLKESRQSLSLDIHPPMERWLRCFKDAKYVICDSFHAAAFSVIYNKNFILLANEERGIDRFKSLLSSLNIPDSVIIYNIDESCTFVENNWTIINKKREEMVQKSMKFLKETLIS